MMSMMVVGDWVPSDWLAMFVMWSVMMVGMMLPSATPMILTYAVISPKRQPTTSHPTAVYAFMLGYIMAWVGFSGLATIAQWMLQRSDLLTPMLVSKSTIFSSIVLVFSGLYQWTPFKQNCLKKCQSPVEYISLNWRNGSSGGFFMGFIHGLFCLGCCWMLMLLLFVGGVMDVLLIAIIAFFVLAEKIVQRPMFLSNFSGVLLISCGAFVFLLGN